MPVEASRRAYRSYATGKTTRLSALQVRMSIRDYLVAFQVQAAIVNGGGILVNIPDPARFALHKITISGERPVSSGMKSTKDIFPASQLIKVLIEDRPGDLPLALEDLRSRGKGLEKRFENGLKLLRSSYSDMHEAFISQNLLNSF